MYVYRIIEAPSRKYRYGGKAISISYSKCESVALVIRHSKRMRRVTMSPVASLALPYRST